MFIDVYDKIDIIGSHSSPFLREDSLVLQGLGCEESLVLDVNWLLLLISAQGWQSSIIFELSDVSLHDSISVDIFLFIEAGQIFLGSVSVAGE